MSACLEQVRRGMAWHCKQYQRDQSPADWQTYAAAEDLAHANHVGLWVTPILSRPGIFGIDDRREIFPEMRAPVRLRNAESNLGST
jgi:hypothetical protein